MGRVGTGLATGKSRFCNCSFECEDKYKFYEEEFESDDAEVWKNELIQEEGITPENYKEYLNDNNCIEVGGFGDWKFSI